MLDLALIGGGIFALLAALFGVFAAGKKAGTNERKAKEADAYEEELERLGKANRARDRVRPTDDVSGDPNNRDSW